MISLIFDTETTGLTLPSIVEMEKQPRIIELAVSCIVDSEWQWSNSWLINPGQPLTKEINKITGITDKDLEGRPSFDEVAEAIKGRFSGADAIWAHNMPFDYTMLSTEFERAGIKDFVWPETLCSANEFRHELGYVPSMKVLYEETLGKPLAQTHRAQDDVDALVEILLTKGVV